VVIGECTRVKPVQAEIPESGRDQQGRRLGAISASPVRVGDPVSDVDIPVVEPNSVQTTPTDEFPALAKDDRKVVLRSVLESPLASTDERPSVVNRVMGRQTDRSRYLPVP
jgi:hypothetical protein